MKLFAIILRSIVVIHLLLSVCYGDIVHKCIHNSIVDRCAKIIPTVHQDYELNENKFQPIRIAFKQHSVGCKIPKEVIRMVSKSNMHSYFNYTCLVADVANQHSNAKLREAMSEVKDLLAKHVKLIPVRNVLSINSEQINASCLFDHNIMKVIRNNSIKETSADLVIHVTMNPMEYGSMAWSQPLAVDQHGRPILGIINYGVQSLKDKSISASKIGEIILHEVIHILGVSKRVHKNQFMKGIILNHNDAFLTSPSVKLATQSHFGCFSKHIVGAKLHSRSDISHLSKSVFGDEVMTPYIALNTLPKLTIITLSSLKDLDWYDIDMRKSSEYIWGINKGCSYMQSNNSSTHNQHSSCSEESAYVVKTQPNYHAPFPILSCISPNSLNVIRYGENFSRMSRCFNSSIYKGLGNSVIGGHCYRFNCTRSNKLHVMINGTWFNCETEDKKITLPGYQGNLICPSPDQFCALGRVTSMKKCVKNCNNNGICQNGHCICSSGWKGINCEEKLCPKYHRNTCNSRGVCKANGICACDNYWSGQSCEIASSGLFSINNYIKKAPTVISVLPNSYIYFIMQEIPDSYVQFNVIQKSNNIDDLYLIAKSSEIPTLRSYNYIDEFSLMNWRYDHSLEHVFHSEVNRTFYFAIFGSTRDTRNITVEISVNMLLNISSTKCPSKCQSARSTKSCTLKKTSVSCKCNPSYMGRQCDKKVNPLAAPSCEHIIIRDRWQYFSINVPIDKRIVATLKLNKAVGQNVMLMAHFNEVPALGNKDTLTDFINWSNQKNQIIQLSKPGRWVLAVYRHGKFDLKTLGVASLCIDTRMNNGNSVCNSKTTDSCTFPWKLENGCCHLLQGASLLSMLPQLDYIVPLRSSMSIPLRQPVGHLQKSNFIQFLVTSPSVASWKVYFDENMKGYSKGVEVYISNSVMRSLHDALAYIPFNSTDVIRDKDQFYVVVFALEEIRAEATIIFEQLIELNKKNVKIENNGNRKKGKEIIIITSAVIGSFVVLLLVILYVRRYIRKRTEASIGNKKRNSAFIPDSLDSLEGSTMVGTDGKDKRCRAACPESGSYYYFNERTREVQWEAPDNLQPSSEESLT